MWPWTGKSIHSTGILRIRGLTMYTDFYIFLSAVSETSREAKGIQDRVDGLGGKAICLRMGPSH